MGVSLTVFEILTHLPRKQLRFPTPSLFDTPWRRNALRYQHNVYAAVMYNSVAGKKGLCIRLAVVAFQDREITRNSNKI